MTAREKQVGLNHVVQNKVERMLEGKRGTFEATIHRLEEEGRIAQDFIAPIGVNLKQGGTPAVMFSAGPVLQMDLPQGEFRMHPNAIGQIADKMKIPRGYLKQLAAGDPWAIHLAAYMLNQHLENTEKERVLVRAVGTQVRGIVSERYKRISSLQVLEAFMQEACNQSAVVADAYMNDTKVWVETILPQPINVPTQRNGDVMMYMGARFSTSDYGDGSVDMRAFLLNGVCLNGMVRESVMKQIHLGAKLPDNIALSQETYELDTRATVSAVRDLTYGLFSMENIRQRAFEIQAASEMPIEPAKEVMKLVKGGLLMKREGDEVQQIMMRNRPEDGVQGEATLWKLTQAITAHARELTPERSRDLQEISGELMKRVNVN